MFISTSVPPASKGLHWKKYGTPISCITSSVVSGSKKHRFTSLAISITRSPITSDCTPRLECFWVKTPKKPHLICESDWSPAQADTVWAQTPGMWAAAGSTTRDLPSCCHHRCLPCCNKRSRELSVSDQKCTQLKLLQHLQRASETHLRNTPSYYSKKMC